MHKLLYIIGVVVSCGREKLRNEKNAMFMIKCILILHQDTSLIYFLESDKLEDI